jgi:CubicO group peptidase (beta-lactamase class C family)
MTRSKITHSFTACLAAVLLGASHLAGAEDFARGEPEALGLSAERLERLGAALEDYAEREQVAGSVTLVLRHGKVAYFDAVGHRDAASKAPMREDTIFRIASQTKAIVSTAAMILQEEGKLLISDPVGKYIPEFAETTVAVEKDAGDGYEIVPADRAVTIRDLLTHTSGFDYGDGLAKDRWEAAGITGYYFSDRDEPIGETVARMSALPAVAQPGEEWVYGYSTDILGAVLEKASGQPLDELLADRLFEPLGMQDTYFYLPEGKRDRLATLYALKGGKIARAQEDGWNGQGAFIDGPRKSFSGGAGLLSTATDYARFLQMILNEGELDGVRVLSPKTVALMSVNHLDEAEFAPGEGFGLGFSVLEDLGLRGRPGSVGELGWGGAYHTSYWIDPAEELVVVYMTQLLPAGDLDDHGKLRALVYQAIVD